MKKSICLIVFVLAILPVKAQDIKSLFRNMPDSILPIFTANNRADCIDFMDSKMKAEVKNSFKGTSQMTDLTPNYISINTSDASTWQMKLFTAPDSTRIIGVINTCMAPVADSDITFYNTSWKELPLSDFITLPQMSDFFVKPEAAATNDSIAEGYNSAVKQDIFLMKATFNKQSTSLTFTLTIPDYLNKEAAEKIKPYLRSSLVYVWKNSRFSKD